MRASVLKPSDCGRVQGTPEQVGDQSGSLLIGRDDQIDRIFDSGQHLTIFSIGCQGDSRLLIGEIDDGYPCEGTLLIGESGEI